jgi:hypothetical protein
VADTNNVRLALRETGRQARWLAAKMSISEGYLSQMISGARPWTEAYKDAVATHLGIPKSLLFAQEMAYEQSKIADAQPERTEQVA